MTLTFKQYLNELTSIGDDNVIGGLLSNAKSNLQTLKKTYPSEKSIIDGILTGLNRIEQDPTISYIDGYSTINYLQQLNNPKISISSLREIGDALSTGEDPSGE